MHPCLVSVTYNALPPSIFSPLLSLSHTYIKCLFTSYKKIEIFNSSCIKLSQFVKSHNQQTTLTFRRGAIIFLALCFWLTVSFHLYSESLFSLLFMLSVFLYHLRISIHHFTTNFTLAFFLLLVMYISRYSKHSSSQIPFIINPVFICMAV